MQRTYPDQGLKRVMLLLVWGVALWIVIATCYLVAMTYTALPMDDEWLDNNAMMHTSTLAVQYNEHKILLARTLLWIDQEVFGYLRIFPLACIMLIQLCHALVLSLLYRKIPGTSTASLALPLALSFLLWAYQWENFVWAFQVQFVAVGAFASMAFACLVWKRNSVWPYYLSALLAILSVYSMANGLLAVWLLVSLAIVTRRSAAGIIFLLLVAIGITSLYLHDYHQPPTTDHKDILGHLSQILCAAAHYLGKPLATLLPAAWQNKYFHFYYDAIAVYIGVVGVALVLVALAILWRRRKTVQDQQWALFHVLLFVGGTALLTAIGRIDTGVSRYGTPVLVAWLALWFLLDSLCRPTSRLWRTWHLVLSTFPIVVIVSAMSFQQTDYMTDARNRINRIKHYETAILTGVDDGELLIYMGANYTWPYFSPVFSHWKTQHQGIYANEWAHWLGKKLPEEISAAEACPVGAFDSLQPVPIDVFSGYQGGWRIQGWLAQNNSMNNRIVLLDDDGIVAGYGRVEARPIIGSNLQPPFTWYGHAGLNQSTALHAYAMDSDDNFCLIASSGLVDIHEGIRLVTRGDSLTGETIPMQAPVLSGWKPLPPQTDGHWHVPVPGNAYSTHAALLHNGEAIDDIGGDFSWASKSIDKVDQLVIPLYLGYERHNLSMEVVDPDTGKAFATLDDLSVFAHMRWHYWVVQVPNERNIRRFEIRAHDNSIGVNAHQGISISNPLWMRLR